MGRAGGGSHHSGGGSFGGGHHSGGSSSGGHHVGSSSHRAGGSSGFGGGRPSGGGFGGGGPYIGGGPHPGGGFFDRPPRRPPMYGGPAVPPPPPVVHVHHGYGEYERRENRALWMVVAIVMIVLCMLFGAFKAFMYQSGGITSSTVVRTKLTDSHAYRTGNVTDDLGWLSSKTKTEKGLKSFYEETGVQPYVYFKAYDSTLTTDSEKEAWAKTYFDTELDDSDGFLFVYFAEADTDNDVGYMSYVAGSRAQSVLDSEAIEIFWGYIDRYWTTNMSTDDVIIQSFDKTANAIMHVSTTGKDIAKYAIITVIIIGGGIVAICFIKTKRKAEKEKAEETERILNTPLEKSSTEDLVDKYSDS